MSADAGAEVKKKKKRRKDDKAKPDAEEQKRKLQVAQVAALRERMRETAEALERLSSERAALALNVEQRSTGLLADSRDDSLSSSGAGKLNSSVTLSSSTQQLVASDSESTEKVVYSGWLTKKGRKVRNWKKRWCIVQGKYLSYYLSPSAKAAEKKGEINLGTCIIEELSHREESVRPCMALVVEGRKFLFHADTQKENQHWYKILVCKHEELKYVGARTAQEVMDDPVVQFLVAPSATLRLCHRDIPARGFIALANVIRAVDALHHVCLRYSSVDDLSCCQLAAGLRQHYGVKTLDLRGNDISPVGAQALGEMIRKNRVLRHLDVSVNHIGDEGVTYIANAMPGSMLTELVIDCNNVSPVGASAVLLAMQQNRNISAVYIGDNDIGDAGFTRVLQLCSLTRQISSIRAPRCGISKDGVMKLANIVNTLNLRYLYLSGNRGLKNSDAMATLLRALSKNSSLELVDLGHITLTRRDLDALQTAEECGVLSF
eukprot:TRINITY_DN3643_c0_g1_i3.p1 TRINITY_DN3643_c0_g1~~TRINITY_DN3643_c0_g1_i3.p1  ORF type:complete len:525 (-),score=166.55 TRINITY_DN3643_c0_g1_i3:1269-2738(-)